MGKPFPEQSDDRVRAVLQWLCKDPQVLRATTEGFRRLEGLPIGSDMDQVLDGNPLEFSTQDNGSKKRPLPSDGETDRNPNAKAAKKSAVSTPLTKWVCMHCSAEFTMEDNYKRACRCHTGKIEVDHEDGYWDDDPPEKSVPWEDEDSLINTKENRINHPDGFCWSCCLRKTSKDGCELRAHVPMPLKGGKKDGGGGRKRVGTESGPIEVSSDGSGSEASVDESESEEDEEDFQAYRDEQSFRIARVVELAKGGRVLVVVPHGLCFDH